MRMREVNAELRSLSLFDGRDVYEMLQEIPLLENAFINDCNGKSYLYFKRWLMVNEAFAKGIKPSPRLAPQTIFWLYTDGEPVGIGKLRHYLTDELRIQGGHIAYAIRESRRNRGLGKLLLKLLLGQAGAHGISRALVTIFDDNHPSLRVALANGGVIEKTADNRHYVWIDC